MGGGRGRLVVVHGDVPSFISIEHSVRGAGSAFLPAAVDREQSQPAPGRAARVTARVQARLTLRVIIFLSGMSIYKGFVVL